MGRLCSDLIELKNNVKFCSRDPGGMLNEEFLAEYGLSQNQLVKTISNPAASVDCD
jgi:plasmid maintenance system antidote protein VapI